MSPKTLLESIQKIVNENEKLRNDLEDKLNLINTLRENINQLHERNQRYVSSKHNTITSCQMFETHKRVHSFFA
jgi:hypothetical protein